MKAWWEQSHVSNRWLLGVAACCSVIVMAELVWPHRLNIAAESSAALPPAADVVSVDASRPGPLNDYRLIADRPLFTMDRRPYQPPQEERAPAAPPQPVGPRVEFELSAIITSASAQMAFLKSNLSPEVQKVAVNQSIEGWTLAEVREREVVLRNGAQVVVVGLRADAEIARRLGRAPIDSLARQ